MLIQNYADFIAALLDCGFSMGSSNAENIFTLCAYDFSGTHASENIRWHTGDSDTDPWEWRMRVLDERDDIAYAKVFFKKSGYITKAWYPYFFSARRSGMSFDERYEDGKISHFAKRIYDVIKDADALPFHAIKQLAGFTREDKPKFERALVELQMGLYITMCGRQQKVSQMGLEYGWSSTVFCTTERFWGDEVFSKAASISEKESVDAITEQVYNLNPSAEPKKIIKFIKG